MCQYQFLRRTDFATRLPSSEIKTVDTGWLSNEQNAGEHKRSNGWSTELKGWKCVPWVVPGAPLAKRRAEGGEQSQVVIQCDSKLAFTSLFSVVLLKHPAAAALSVCDFWAYIFYISCCNAMASGPVMCAGFQPLPFVVK